MYWISNWCIVEENYLNSFNQMFLTIIKYFHQKNVILQIPKCCRNLVSKLVPNCDLTESKFQLSFPSPELKLIVLLGVSLLRNCFLQKKYDFLLSFPSPELKLIVLLGVSLYPKLSLKWWLSAFFLIVGAQTVKKE